MSRPRPCDNCGFPAPGVSRRAFCAGAAATLAAAGGAHWLPQLASAPRPEAEVARLDRARILRAARRYLKEPPVTVTAASSPRSAGGRHDYFSEGDYWWPDPQNPAGSYIQRDGYSNPDNFNAHRAALIRLSVQSSALAAAWVLTRDAAYARHAAAHLRAWFINPGTRMNPNLQYAQAIHGRTTGRGIGIIDTVHLVEVVRGASHLARSGALAAREQEAIRHWFAEYLAWITTSTHGQEERDAKNNHGTCWVVQAAEFARFTGNREVTAFCRDRFRTVLAPNQIAPDGSFPQEMRRTKPYGYCLFNLDAMAMVCQILSTPDESLWLWQLPDGRGMRRAMEFMVPYIRRKDAWPLAPDVQYFQYWPVRHPALLFGGLALARPEYVELWRGLDPEPTVDEIVRNFPYRQPLLWLAAT